MLSKRFHLLALLLLPLAFVACDGDPADPDPDPDPEPDGYAFIYTPPAGAPAITSISVRGSFNNWGDPPGSPLAMERQDDGSWVAYVELDSTTTYLYKFFVNGEWIADMCSDATWGHEDHGGLVHLETDGCESDGFGGQNAILVLGEIGLGFTHTASDPQFLSIANERLSIRFLAREGQVESARLVAGDDTVPMHLQLTLGLEDIWRVSIPTGAATYSMLLETTDGAQSFGPYGVPANLFRAVSWASDAVAYQIFPERFWNGDPSNDSLTLTTDEFVYNTLWETNGPTLAANWSSQPNSQHCCHQYYGGDLQGILEKLDHLTALGVDVVYLNPIWHSGSAHGYDQFDYLMLAPEYGEAALLRTFVDGLHAAGIRIIWDFVPNHSGLGFAPFQHAVTYGDTSSYWDWYDFHPDGNGLQAGDADDYDAWFGFGSLPKLETSNPEVFDYLIGVATHWTEYGFDGIRVDVPNELENRTAFFQALRTETKAIYPDVYLVGEIWYRDPSWVQGDQFDALMNYALGQEAAMKFARAEINGSAAWHTMAQLYAAYPEASSAMAFNIAASHDTERLLTMVGGGELGSTPSMTALARQRLASAILYAIPGMPVTYYGDECAMLGTNAGSIHRARRTMQWDSCDAAMLAHYTQLAGLKHGLDALGSAVIREHSSGGSVLTFLRGEPGPGEVLAVFNQSAGEQTVTLPAGSWQDAVTGAVLTGSAPVPAYGWRYLVRS